MTNRDKFLLAALLTLIPCLTLSSAAGKSATFGEPEHLLAGYHALKSGAPSPASGVWGVRLSGEAAAIFFRLFNRPVYLPPLTDQSQMTLQERSVLFMARNGLRAALFWARLPFTILSILLAAFLFHVVKRFYGVRSGLFALFLYVLCPGILAYSRLCTADFTAMATMFVATVFFLIYLEGGKRRMFLACSGALAAALLSSESMFILVPAFALMMAVNWLLAPKGRLTVGGWLGSLARGTSAYCVMMLVTFAVIWAVYHFEMRPFLLPGAERDALSRSKVLAPLATFMGEERTDRLYNDAANLLERTKIPAASFFRAAAKGILHPDPPQPYYLRGRYGNEGWWYYFPLAFLVKVPIPLTALFVIGLAAISLRPGDRLRRDLLFLIPPVLFFAAAMAWSPDTGFHQIVAVLPFVIVIASRMPARREEKAGRIPAPVTMVLVAALGLWYAIASFGIYPDYLAYFNEIAGGPDGGKEWLAASDKDRGQDLPGLAGFMTEHGIGAVHLSYFGPVDPALYGIATPEGRQFTVPDTGAGPFARKVAYKPSFGYVAVSATNLQGLYFEDKKAFDWLKDDDIRPVANIGYTIYLYEILEPPVPANGNP